MNGGSNSNRRSFLQTGIAVAVATLASSTTTPSLAADSDQWADLIGRLVYDGPPPERKKLKIDKDIECCGKFDIRDESSMVGEHGGLEFQVWHERVGYIETPAWPRGRFEVEIRPGGNDLGTIKLAPDIFGG